MRIAVIHNAVINKDSPDERDVLIQADSIGQALISLGHKVQTIACGLDLNDLLSRIRKMDAEIVFNLVESLENRGRLIHLVPSLLDTMAIPYTGASAESLFMTSNKVLAKERMEQFDLPTPLWIGPYPKAHPYRNHFLSSENQSQCWIIKSVWEHASVGLDKNSIIKASDPQIISETLKNRVNQLGGACFAERFIDGREFNLSLLSGPDGLLVLPVAEILFDGYGHEKHRIVDYRAKWDESSFEYHHTTRTFLFDKEDAALISHLKNLAVRCWEVFGLQGYARIDFRVDIYGQPWILEVNANPCLSPDAGFAASSKQAGISYHRLVKQIVKAALGHFFKGLTESSPKRIKKYPDDSKPIHAVNFRYEIEKKDGERVRQMLNATGFFSSAEICVAAELVGESFTKGLQSDYRFIIAEKQGLIAGFTCYGPIPCTEANYDLYWIAVHPDYQRQGLGKKLLRETEDLIKAAGGKRLYVETSQRPQYSGTRAFYESEGYCLEAVLDDFFKPGEGKAIYCKRLLK
jgi:D-alanine-D-alanine ligase